MVEVYRPSEMYTLMSGRTKLWDLLDPGHDTDPPVFPAEMVHALSNQCRFNGHTREFYSVAQHSVLVYQLARRMRPRDWRFHFYALMHDAHEAWIGDVTEPFAGAMECVLPGFKARLRVMKEQHDLLLWRAWNVPPPDIATRAEIKELDMRAFDAECRCLFGHEVAAPDIQPILPLPPKEAAFLFRNCLDEAVAGLERARVG